MVSSLDGKATLDWRTKGLSTELDRRLFHHLRTQADAVMVGAGTVRIERYGRMTKNDELRDKRVARGPGAGGARGGGERAARSARRPAAAQRARAGGADRHRLRGALPGLGAGTIEYARVGDDLPPPDGRPARARRALGALRGRPDAELVPVRGRPRGRAVPDDEPQARGRRGGAHDRRRAASWWSRSSSTWCPWRRRRRALHPLAGAASSVARVADPGAVSASNRGPMATARTERAAPRRRPRWTCPSSSSRT